MIYVCDHHKKNPPWSALLTCTTQGTILHYFAATFHHHTIFPIRIAIPSISCPHFHMLSNMFCSLFIWLDSTAPLREGAIWLLSLWLYVTSHKHYSGCVLSLWCQLDSSPSIIPIKQLTGHTNCLRITTLKPVLWYYSICLKITQNNSNELQASVSYLFRSHLRKRLYKVQPSQEKTSLKKDLPGY